MSSLDLTPAEREALGAAYAEWLRFPFDPGEFTGAEPPNDPQAEAVQLFQRLLRAVPRLAEVQGAMRADDERLNAAAVKVWGENIHGCDAPDWMAEEIIGLRAERDAAVAIAREALGMLDANDPDALWTDEANKIKADLATLTGEG